VARRPDLWVTALAVAGRLLPRRRRRSGRRLGRRAYLAFRMETAYGDPKARPRPDDLVAYLEWCRREPRPGGYRG